LQQFRARSEYDQRAELIERHDRNALQLTAADAGRYALVAEDQRELVADGLGRDEIEIDDADLAGPRCRLVEQAHDIERTQHGVAFAGDEKRALLRVLSHLRVGQADDRLLDARVQAIAQRHDLHDLARDLGHVLWTPSEADRNVALVARAGSCQVEDAVAVGRGDAP
jgi:hypothetical protein